jgi:hypothetical protein
MNWKCPNPPSTGILVSLEMLNVQRGAAASVERKDEKRTGRPE